MTAFVYLLAEGVTDVTLIQRVLRCHMGMQQAKDHGELPEKAQQWLAQFKWPYGDDISRLAVPAPVFMQREKDVLVAIRNAQGIGNLNKTLEVDEAAFELIDWKPDALGVLLDADDRPPDDRFREYRDNLEVGDLFPLRVLESAESVETRNERRGGMFVFPGGGHEGTIDTLLESLGKSAFSSLHDAASKFVTSWHPEHSTGDYFREIRKPAGPRKALLSSMAAILKPGKNLNASVQDHPWIPEGSASEALQPLVEFLEAIVG